MTNHTKTLEALVAAGDEATEGEWKTDMDTHDQPHQDIKILSGGMSILTVWQDDACFELNPTQIGSARFTAQSANARPALKALLDELKEKDRVMAVMAEALLDAQDICHMHKHRHQSLTCLEALAQFEKIKWDV